MSPQKIKCIVPCWRYLLRNNRLSHLIVHSLYLFQTPPSVLHHCRARILELSNRRLSLDGNGPLHCLLLRVVRPEQPNRPSSFRGVLRFPVCFFSRRLARYRYIRPVGKPARLERLPDKLFVSPDRHPRQLCFTFALSLIHTDPYQWGR
jgi:hypothetical protein